MDEIKKGDRFSELEVLREVTPRHSCKHFLCICDCGKKSVVSGWNLTSGKTKSCGCLRVRATKKSNTTHGLTKHPLYSVWNQMKQRCTNPKAYAYENYGGRGVNVCKNWKESFQSFYDWALANGYKRDLEIDRIDNDGNYEPSNCRWATPKKQANNRRNNRHITFQDKTLTLAEWEKETGIKQTVIYKRLKRGWDVEKTLTTPLQTQNQRLKNES